MLDRIGSDDPPAHLLPGADAARLVGDRLTALQAAVAAWRTVTRATGVTG